MSKTDNAMALLPQWKPLVEVLGYSFMDLEQAIDSTQAVDEVALAEFSALLAEQIEARAIPIRSVYTEHTLSKSGIKQLVKQLNSMNGASTLLSIANEDFQQYEIGYGEFLEFFLDGKEPTKSNLSRNTIIAALDERCKASTPEEWRKFCAMVESQDEPPPAFHSQRLVPVPAEQTQNAGCNTEIINGREAVPVRLLPFATRWITSKRWLEIFRHKDEEMTLTARHLRDGYVLDEIPIDYWVKLDDLAPFPPKAFVWRDELESAYSAHFRSDNDLLLDGPLRDQDRKWVFEGFDALQIDTSGMPTEREIWAISYNNANPVGWDLLGKFDLIKKREAILYMHGLNPGEHAAIKAGLSDEAVPDTMPRRVADSEEAKGFFIDVSKALKIASSGKMKKLTAAEWVVWATKKGIQVHSQFRAIAERQDGEKRLGLNEEVKTDAADSAVHLTPVELVAKEAKSEAPASEAVTTAEAPLALPAADLPGANKEQAEWIAKSVELANVIGLKKWNDGERQITARNICNAVATALGEGEPGAPQKYHGNQGPRSAGAVRSVALKGWKFIHPSGTNGTNGTNRISE